MHLIRQIMRLIQRIQDTWTRFVNRVNALLSYVPDALRWVLDRINELWNQVLQMWEDFWSGVQHVIDSFGDPEAISAASSSWSRDVAGPAGAMAAEVSPGQLAADDDNWVGQAANQYRTRATEQHQSIAAIRDEIATTVVSALDGLKGALFIFYGATIGAFAALIAGIVGALTISATVVGIPVGVLAIIAAGGVASAAILAAGWNLNVQITTRANEMQMAVTAPSVTRWPQFVTHG